MSTVDDGVKQVYRDKDSIFRDERGLLSMPHVTAFMASATGVFVGGAGLIAFFQLVPDSLQVLQIGLGLVAAGASLEGWQTHVEGKNQRGGQ